MSEDSDLKKSPALTTTTQFICSKNKQHLLMKNTTNLKMPNLEEDTLTTTEVMSSQEYQASNKNDIITPSPLKPNKNDIITPTPLKPNKNYCITPSPSKAKAKRKYINVITPTPSPLKFYSCSKTKEKTNTNTLSESLSVTSGKQLILDIVGSEEYRDKDHISIMHKGHEYRIPVPFDKVFSIVIKCPIDIAVDVSQ